MNLFSTPSTSSLLGIAILLHPLILSAAAQATDLDDLKGVARNLIAAHKTNLRHLKFEASYSTSFASISRSGTSAVIYINPKQLARNNRNTWAFVLGHELAHHILDFPSSCQPADSVYCKEREFACDSVGSKIARKAGYNIREYIRSMLNTPDRCSLSHGCWHERAYRLATLSGIAVTSKPRRCPIK